MKRRTMLTKALVIQMASDLGLSAERDVDTILRRIEHEGFSFLSITLPTLSDALERGLEAGRFSCPSAFARHGRLPRLLGGFFNRVFDRMGNLLPDPDPYAIKGIRQICRFWKKPKIGCSPEMNSRAIARFKEVEDELRTLSSTINKEDITLDQLAGVLWSQVFPLLDSHSLVCSHGPGVTADRYSLNERYRIREWYTRSERSFPADLHAFHNLWFAGGGEEGEPGVQGLNYHDLRDEPGVRVVFVPKTLSGPRVIAIEPSAMQFMQQGLMRYVVSRLESHRLTARSIHFRDQSINQLRAYQSSIDQKLATLDLKDASDRVHLGLVQRIFKSCGILEYLEDSRSLHADLPDGSNLVLTKFASMGSAMCFPVEAMVFYTLVQLAMHKVDGKHPTSRSIRRYSANIDVYGDDIIVPVDYADAVVETLEAYGLRVNVHKSFRHSLFRESCGGDFFNGVSVKPIYAREIPEDDRRKWTANTYMSWVATADQFYLEGYWQMAQTIRDMLESVLRTRIPRARVKTHGIGFLSLMFDTDLRYNPAVCGWYQRRIVYTPSKRKDMIDGDAVACFNRTLGTVRAPIRAGIYDPSDGSYSPRMGHSRQSLSERMVDDTNAELGSDELRSDRHTSSGFIDAVNELLDSLRFDGVTDDGQIEGQSDRLPKNFRVRVLANRVDKILKDTLLKGDQEIDLQSSVKRGAFKSKRRWVTVLS